MKKIIIMGLVGGGLFVGTVLGLLSTSDRLNYKGTRGIPVLEQFFSDPDAKEATPEEKAKAAKAAEEKMRWAAKLPVEGPPVEEPTPAGGGAHGGGHAAPGGETHTAGMPTVIPAPKIKDRRFDPDNQDQHLSGGARYFPGGFFRFPSREALTGKSDSENASDPSGIPIEEELNRRLEALKVRQTRLDERTAKVELDEKGLAMRLKMISERVAAVAKKEQFLAANRKALDAELLKFQDRVILIKPSEMSGIRSYAKELEGLVESDPDKASQVVIGLLGLGKTRGSNPSPARAAEAARRKQHMMKALSLMSSDSFGALIATMTDLQIRTIFKDKMKVAVEDPK